MVSDKARVEATVVTGLESMAREECKERLGISADISRGRIIFEIERHRIKEIFLLQSVDNFYSHIHTFSDIDFQNDLDKDLELINTLPDNMDWQDGIDTWRLICAPQRELSSIFSKQGQSATSVSSDDVATLPSFRVTCNRVGTKVSHSFTSMQAASKFGGRVNDLMHWKVDMKNYDMNLLVNITENSVQIFVSLTSASLHHRHLVDFGPTTLRSTIAYNMLRLAKIKPGEVILDPLCGGGTIPIEAAINWPNNHVMCADHHELAVPRCANNINHVNNQSREHNSEVGGGDGGGLVRGTAIKCDLLRWDSCALPLRDRSVDIIVTDLPFGKRMGSKFDNRKLYPALLKEMARVLPPSTGRAVLLTQDKRSLVKAIQYDYKIWRQGYTTPCNVGGLNAAIYVCHRTENPIEMSLTK